MRWTLRRKMVAQIALPALAIYVAILGTTMVALRAENRADVARTMSEIAENAAARLDGAFHRAASIAATAAGAAGVSGEMTREQMLALLRSNIEQDAAMYGAALALEPADPLAGDLVCPYVYRGPDGLVEMNIGRDQYDWYADERWAWWHEPKRTGRAVWSDPYFDDGAGQTYMVTHSVPITRDGRFAGVLTADVDLDTIERRLGPEVFGEHRFTILRRDGGFVFRGSGRRDLGGTVFDVAEQLGRPDVAEASRRILSGGSGVVEFAAWEGEPPPGFESWSERQLGFYAPMASTGWTVVVLFPEREVMAAANARMAQATAALAATLVLITACVLIVSGRIVRPIQRLRSAALAVAGGDLEANVEASRSGDEVGDLGRAFNTMTEDLRSHVDRLASERETRARLERDLQVARDIQQGLLPSEAPPVAGFELAGWSRPADETGGDYYDWVALPDGRVAVMLADVTGHGLGPALVTAFSRAYARAVLRQHLALPAVLSEMNSLVGEDLSGSRFITFVAALLSGDQDAVEVLSAGHGPILHYRSSAGEIEQFGAHAVPLGVLPEFEFDEAQAFRLERGDVLVLMTDGFFEWPRADGEMFGTERLCETLVRLADRSPGKIIEGMVAAVEAFVGDAVQPDDLTAVVVKRVADGS